MSKQIDPRGPRFGAAITTVVLAVILLTIPTSVATVLLGIQTVVFALGAFVGFLFAATGLIALLAGAELVATVAVGFALGAAFLNAAFNFCLGCEMYLIGKRIFS